MARRPSAHFVCILLLITPLLALAAPAGAEQAGNVAFSTDGLAMSPANPVEGGSVEFTLSLQNMENMIADDVEVEFHKDSYTQGSPNAAHVLDIDADAFAEVDFTWSNLAYGSQTLWMRVSHGVESELISHSFDVGGLANLRFATFEISPTVGVHAGDQIQIAIEVENAGHADAGASHLELTVAGQANLLTVSSLQAGDSLWMNQTATAPGTGEHTILGEVNADSGDGIIESTAADNQQTRTLDVIDHPDYRHAAGPDVSADVGLAGPWTLSGTVVRDGGVGDATVPMEVRVESGLTLQMVNLQFSDADNFAEYSVTIDADSLPSDDAGDTHLVLAIDPSDALEQSNTFNDDATATLTIYDEPNVVVSATAVARPASTTPGLSVSFDVSLQNVGEIPVTGTLSAAFDGLALASQTVIIPASTSASQGQTTVTFTVVASGESRNIPFSATWESSPGSYDRLLDDNAAMGHVVLVSDLQLRFLETTAAWQPGLPLYAGHTYVYSIDVTADQGTGEETFDCVDRRNGIVHDTQTLVFTPEATLSLRCSVHPTESGSIELAVVPHGASTSPHAKVWMVNHDGSTSGPEDAYDETLTVLLFIFAGLIGVALLVGAVILTRHGLADAERETFEMCPACDGDIEGDEDECPHCEFDLRGGRSKFHDCEACTKTIPSLMDHCPYCGEVQDISAQFSRRERKTIALPEETEPVEEEPEVDEDEIVRGHEGFDTHASDLGFEEEQWEGEWDENLGEAEAYFDAQEEARTEAEAEEEAAEGVADVVGTTQLTAAMDELPEHDLDAFLGGVDDRRHLTDEEVELSASDAHYRARLFEITGEDGVMPGDEVNIDSMVDNTVVGNELRKVSSDFTVPDDPTPVAAPAPEPESDPEPEAEEKPQKRRGVRRRKKDV